MFISGPKTNRATAIVQSRSSRSGLGRVGHLRVRLGAEVLDDDLLDVPVFVVQPPQRQQRLDPLAAGFADPDQDPGRERDLQFAGVAHGLQADSGSLSGDP